MANGPNVGNAYCTVVPSMKGFAKQMQSQLSGIDGVGKSIGGSLSQQIARSIQPNVIGNALSGAMTSAGAYMQQAGLAMGAAVTAGFGAATVAVGKYALGVASAAETSEMAFTTMLGGAEQAKDMMSQLADFAAKTPFELSGLVSATQQLLAYGFTAEDVLPMLTAVGDATAALGTGQYGIQAVTRALGQMQTRGKVSAEEMLQLTEQGIPAWEYLARAIGTDTAGAMEQVSKGAISASEGIAALTKGMEEDFGGMMANQATTLTGLMSNLSDAIEKPLMTLKDTSGYEALTEALSGLVDEVGPFAESLIPVLSDGLEGLAGVIKNATSALDTFGNASGIKEILALAGAVGTLGPALVGSGTALQALAPAASATAGAMSKIVKPAQNILTAFTDVPRTAKSVKSGFDKLKGSVKTARKGFVNMASAAIMFGGALKDGTLTPLDAVGVGVSGLGTKAAALGTGLSSVSSSVVSGLVPAFAGLATAIGGGALVITALAAGIAAVAAVAGAGGADIQAFGVSLSAAITDLGTFATTAINNVTAALPQVTQQVATAAPMIVNSLIQAFSNIGQAASQLLPQFGQLVLTIVPEVARLIAEGAPMLLQGALTMFGGAVDAVAQAVPLIAAQVPTLIQGIVTALSTGIPQVLMGFVNLFGSITQAIPQVIPQIAAALPQITNTICQALPVAIPQLIAAAGQFLIGIVQAIPQVLPSILAAVGTLITTIITNIPTFIGALLQAAYDLFMAICEAIPQVVPQVLVGIANLLQDVWDAITSFDLLGAGQDLIQGFIDGITSMAGALWDAAVNTVSNAVNGIMDFLGIASPSKLFREIGDYTMQGMAIGIAAGAGDVLKSVDSVMSDVYGSTSVLADVSADRGVRAVPAQAGNTVNANIYIDGETAPARVQGIVLDLLEALYPMGVM